MFFGGKMLINLLIKPVIYDEFQDNTSREHYMYPNEARLEI